MNQESHNRASPSPATIPVEKLEDDFYDWYARHEKVKEQITKQTVDLIFIGDSITHMFGGMPESSIVRGGDVWEHHYGHRNAVNMGFGWDRTQNVLWRLTHGELDGIAPRVAVLLVGTNNFSETQNAAASSPAEVVEAIGMIAETIQEASPACQILHVSILPRRPASFTEPILEANDLLAALARENQRPYLDLHSCFANPANAPKADLMHDDAHPNNKGYQLWAETMEPVLSQMLGDTPVSPLTDH